MPNLLNHTANFLDDVLMRLAPDRRTTALVWSLTGLALLIGVLELLTGSKSTAEGYLQLSLLIAITLVLVQFLTVRAAYVCAASAQKALTLKLHQQVKPGPASDKKAEAALERAEMAALAATLRDALAVIPADSPIRAKYSATLEWLRRIESNSAAQGR